MPDQSQAIRHKLLNTFSRHSVWLHCIFIALLITSFHIGYDPHYIHYFVSETLLNSIWVITTLLSLLGLYDLLQNKHSILKNYPIMGHFIILKNFDLKFDNILLNLIKMHCHFHVCNAV